MDPITLAITTGLANLSQEAIKDAYGALKKALQQKFGVDSDLVEAVDRLEKKPDSKARQAVIQEEVESSNAAQDPDLLRIANTLLERLRELPNSKIDINQDIKIKGNRNIVTGQGDVSVNE